MGFFWNIFVDDEDLAKRVQRAIKHSDFIIEIREQVVQTKPIINENFDNLRQELYEEISRAQVDWSNNFNNRLRNSERNLQAELEGIAREILTSLRQEIHEEISRVQVDFDKKINQHLQEIESKIPVAQPAPLAVDLTSLLNAIKQLRADNQQLTRRLSELEKKSTPPAQDNVDSSPLPDAISQLRADNQQLARRLSELEKKSTPPAQDNFDSSPLPDAISQLRADNQQLARRLSELEKKSTPPIVAPSENISGLQSQIEVLSRSADNLKRTLLLQSKNLDSLKSANKSLKQLCDSQKQIIDALNERVTKLEKVLQDKQPDKQPPTKPWITYFSIPRSKNPATYFDGDSANTKAKLTQSIQEMDALITNLTQAEIDEPAKTSFLKNLNGCMKDLEKLYSKFKFDNYDEDELSEAITNKFFKAIGDNLLDNVVIAIYRGGEFARGYKNFLNEVNRYLTKHGIYTEIILPGELVEGDMLANIEPPIAKKTNVATDDGKIGEVELLPYFMNYKDDNGNVDTIRKRGRVIRLKYGV